jgi:predicted CXXCH cytochrome family protein
MRHVLVFAAVVLTAVAGRAACDSCHDPENRDTHPVAIDYARARLSNLSRLRPTTAVASLLVDGRVECISCHASHETENDQRYRLRMDENALCLSCHIVN